MKHPVYYYMNLFTHNSPYYNLLKYLLFLMKHPVYYYYYHNYYYYNYFSFSFLYALHHFYRLIFTLEFYLLAKLFSFFNSMTVVFLEYCFIFIYFISSTLFKFQN